MTVPEIRRPARFGSLGTVLASAALLVIAAVLGIGVHGKQYPTAVDAWFYGSVAHELGHDPAARNLLLAVTWPVLVGVLMVVLAVLAYRRGERRLALLAFVAPPAATALASVLLKPVFDRTYHGYLSYPSGHTTFLVATLVVLVIAHRRLAVAAVVVAAIGMFGLVVGRYHYLTDTIGGAALACAVTLGLWLLLRGSARSAWTPPADTSSGTHLPPSPR